MQAEHGKQDPAIQKAASIYSKLTLSIYDILVLGFSNTLLWQCPTQLLLDHYNKHISLNHLDVGVGTGYFLDKCQFPRSLHNPNIHLLDLNPNSLEVTAKRINRYHPTIYEANILEPLALKLPKFDSIAINYLLHCVPGNLQTKEIVFKNLIPLLNEHGSIFGSTILGKNTKPNFFATKIMNFYNTKGIFNNLNDDYAGLEKILQKNFKTYSIKLVGCVAVFHGNI